MEEKKQTPINITDIFKKLWPHKKLYFKVLPATLILTYICSHYLFHDTTNVPLVWHQSRQVRHYLDHSVLWGRLLLPWDWGL